MQTQTWTDMDTNTNLPTDGKHRKPTSATKWKREAAAIAAGVTVAAKCMWMQEHRGGTPTSAPAAQRRGRNSPPPRHERHFAGSDAQQRLFRRQERPPIDMESFRPRHQRRPQSCAHPRVARGHRPRQLAHDRDSRHGAAAHGDPHAAQMHLLPLPIT
jgi:hypothetical protein